VGAASRVAVLGDVGGWDGRLEEVVTLLRGDLETGALPDDLVVVQVGDLVGKGPGSLACLELVERFQRGSPGRWLQVVGNHEAAYLPHGSGAPGSPDLAGKIEHTLRQWQEAGKLRLAVAVELDGGGQALVSHGGLTRGRWERAGSPESAAEAAVAIERQWHEDPDEALGSGRACEPQGPGVVWAEAPGEVVASWLCVDRLPFNQVHGHKTCYDWDHRQWSPVVPPGWQPRCEADPEARHSVVRWPEEGWIAGIDPRYTAAGAPVRLVPLVLSGWVCR